MRSLISGKINSLHFLFLLFFIHTYLRVFSETHWKHSLNGGKRGGIGKGGDGGRGNGRNNGEETRTCYYCKQMGHILFNGPKLLGHKGEAKTIAVASYYGVKLTGK